MPRLHRPNPRTPLAAVLTALLFASSCVTGSRPTATSGATRTVSEGKPTVPLPARTLTTISTAARLALPPLPAPYVPPRPRQPSRPAPTAAPSHLEGQGGGGDYHHWPDWPTWRCIGRHEQRWVGPGPDPWGDGIAWHGSRLGGTAGSDYPGGLGISRPAWSDAVHAGITTISNGADADPATQIRVGEWLVRKYHGYRGWATHTLCGV